MPQESEKEHGVRGRTRNVFFTLVDVRNGNSGRRTVDTVDSSDVYFLNLPRFVF